MKMTTMMMMWMTTMTNSSIEGHDKMTSDDDQHLVHTHVHTWNRLLAFCHLDEEVLNKEVTKI
jgi:hypothetical protein